MSAVSTQKIFFSKKYAVWSVYFFFVLKKMATLNLLAIPNKRLLERGNSLLTRLVEKRSCIIRQISLNWSEEMGFWRYLKNPKIHIE
jgi:hypothetical protein